MSLPDRELAETNRQLEQFLELLEEEAVALSSGDGTRLEDLTRQRHAVSRQLAEAWQALAAGLGLDASAGLPALRLRAFNGGSANAEWQRLERLTHEAGRMNRINGRLIEEQMRRTQSALQVLQSASSRTLYGADGRLNDLLNTSRSIDSA
jgi:flagellar biosynthesis/type III secretory pathway chaperone